MMFPMPMPEMPQEIMDAVSADPGAFATALGDGMDAFQGAMADGGDMGAAFEAMGDVMGPIMQDMGVSPEAFDAAGDVFGAAIGGGMHMAPADAGGAEMGAMMQDAASMMMPEGMDVPAPVMDAMGDMGQGFADAGCAPHDMAGEMMPPPGEPGFPLPCDANGDCIVPAGDPAACPADACQPPPMDGACADVGGAMMPPEGGYEHAPMPVDATMPPPMDMGNMATVDPATPVADDPMAGNDPNAGMVSEPAMDQANDPNAGMVSEPAMDQANDPNAGMVSEPAMDQANDPNAGMMDGGMGALGDALGGQMDDPNAGMMGDAADAAIGQAMDSAMDQGGSPAPTDNASQQSEDPNAGMIDDDQGQPDPSAGMG